MRFKSPLLFLVLISFFSCEKTEEKITENPIAEDPIEEPIVEDETEPELTISGFSDIIETTTDISISIADASSVETKVMHGGEEIATSSEKQFDITINPYGMPVGNTEYTIISKDAKGNETSKNYSVEIKHLLMINESLTGGPASGRSSWFFFNDLEGYELATYELTGSIQKFYTDKLISADKIYISTAYYREPTSRLIGGLVINTYKLLLGETRLQKSIEPQTPLNHSFDFTINLEAPYEGERSFRFTSSNYNTFNSELNGLSMKLEGLHDGKTPLYLRMFDDPRIDITKKENYRYFKVQPEANDIVATVNETDLLLAENNIVVNIPTHEPGSFNIFRTGFKDETDVSTNIFHRIYNFEEHQEMIDTIDLPIVSGLGIYSNRLSYKKDGKEFSTVTYDNELDVSMPDWAVSGVVNTENIVLNADNQEVDMYSVIITKNNFANSNLIYRKDFTWVYKVFGKEDSSKLAPRLSLPDTISSSIDDPFFTTTEDLQQGSILGMDYKNLSIYNEIVQLEFLYQIQIEPKDKSSRSVRFPGSE